MSGLSSPLRVVQWSTGNAGRKALAGIVRHPELELVGVHAHAADKIGRDAAELCGLEAPLLQPGMLKAGWGDMVLKLADAMGPSLDEIREEHERLPAPPCAS